ncbi:TBCC domain-containing protein 1 [Camellia lanceoleosa]|uniref:TBCC domain-containing protein 1 n=1 Tax=Camellia lanceoleosa TaxID=1840588 RepID=A0ACC0G8U0_9ERIC|nr:TBCC domain-containing protein 1 [Camellia lanceoleosa]
MSDSIEPSTPSTSSTNTTAYIHPRREPFEHGLIPIPKLIFSDGTQTLGPLRDKLVERSTQSPNQRVDSIAISDTLQISLDHARLVLDTIATVLHSDSDPIVAAKPSEIEEIGVDVNDLVLFLKFPLPWNIFLKEFLKENGSSSASDQGVAMADACQASDLKGSSVKVINCHESVIYILAPLRYATIYGCSDTTIVLGAVGKAVRVEHCERVHVIVAAKRICIANCRECVFFLGVNQRPLIVGDNHKLQVAPYNTFYSQLETHMDQVGIEATINRWDDPVIPNWFEGESSGSTKGNPFPLPDVYMSSQHRNHNNLGEIKQILKESITGRQRA